MAYYAKVNNGIVEKVIVADASYFDGFVDSSPGAWIETSDTIRKNYAGVGMLYDSFDDVFYKPQPYASWTLNEETCVYDPPIDYPNDGKIYDWDESAYQADNTKGWVEVT